MTLTAKNTFCFVAARAAIAGALLAALGSATTVRAADPSKEDRMPRTYTALMKMQPVEVMHLMDPDEKGYVTHDEFRKFYDELFKRMDKNHDGKVTEPEFTDRG